MPNLGSQQTNTGRNNAGTRRFDATKSAPVWLHISKIVPLPHDGAASQTQEASPFRPASRPHFPRTAGFFMNNSRHADVFTP